MHVRKNNFKVGKSTIICTVVIFVFMLPPLFSYIESLWTAFSYIKMALMGAILILILPRIKSLSIVSVFVSIYYACFIISTIATNGNIMKSINAVTPQLCFFLFTDYMLKNKTKSYINSLSRILVLYILTNTLVLLVFPDGVGRFIPGYNYNAVDSRLSILGLDNTYIKYYIIAIVVFYYVFANKAISRNMLYFIMLLTMLYVMSGNGVVCLVVLMAYIFLVDNGKLKKLITLKSAFIIGAVSFSGVVLLRSTDLFGSFFERYLGKDITFTGRTLLWDRALVLISQQPILGYGVYDYNLLISSANGQAYSAHDTILQMMLMGGVVVLIAFLLVVLVCGRKVEKSSNSYGKSMMIMAMLIMWVAGLLENMVLDYTLILVFVLAGHYDSIANTFPKELKKKDWKYEAT